MGRGRRQRQLSYLTHQISQSQALAHIANNEIDQSTLPDVVLRHPSQEAAVSFHGADDDPLIGEPDPGPVHGYDHPEGFVGTPSPIFNSKSDSDSKTSLSVRSRLSSDSAHFQPGESCSAEQELHVMFGGNINIDSSTPEQLEEDNQPEKETIPPEQNEEVSDDNGTIEIDAHEHAMLDINQLCQEAGTSLQFFDNLVTTLRRHGKKGFDIRKASKRQTFLDKR